MRNKFFILFNLFVSLTILSTQAQNDSIKNKSLTIGGMYTTDNIMNLRGGIDRGFAHINLTQLQLNFDAEKAGWWKGGSFFMNLSNSYNTREASEELVGDLQVVSGIEAGDHLFFQDLWWRQEFENFEFTLGIQELNVETAHLELGELFVHSSFGVSPILSANFDGPIYPYTSLGITTKWFISDKTTWLNAFYAGKASDRDKYVFNVNWTFKPGSGNLYISEIQQKTVVNQLPGVYKVGLFSNNHVLEKAFTNNFPDSLAQNSYGAYAMYEQTFWKQDKRQLCAFVEMGVSPADYSINKLYLSAAGILKGFLSKKRGDDILGFGGSYAKLEKGKGHESYLELSWKRPITDYFYIQPDIHYVITPSGKTSGLRNAFLVNMRLGIEL